MRMLKALSLHLGNNNSGNILFSKNMIKRDILPLTHVVYNNYDVTFEYKESKYFSLRYKIPQFFLRIYPYLDVHLSDICF